MTGWAKAQGSSPEKAPHQKALWCQSEYLMLKFTEQRFSLYLAEMRKRKSTPELEAVETDDFLWIWKRKHFNKIN